MEDTTRKARYLELLLEEGKLDEVETVLLSQLQSFEMTDLAARLYLEPLSKLILKLDLAGQATRARNLDLQLMSVCADSSAIRSGRLLASYDRLLKAVLESRDGTRLAAFHRETLSLLQGKLPVGHPIVETMWLRLAEFQYSAREADSALSTLAELDAAMTAVGRSQDAPVRLHLEMLRCECLIRKKMFGEAEELLTSLEERFERLISTRSTSGVVLQEEKWRARLTRSRNELTRVRALPPPSGN